MDSVSPLLLCTAFVPLTHELNRADCGYKVHGTARKIRHLLYADGLKLLGRNEDDSENGIKIVTAISKDINTNFGLEKCTNICLKKDRVQSKAYVGNIFRKDIKGLDSRAAYKY